MVLFGNDPAANLLPCDGTMSYFGPILCIAETRCIYETSLKHKRDGTQVSVLLECGSLLVMKDAPQSHWFQCIPKSKEVTSPRINLTFRTMVHS